MKKIFLILAICNIQQCLYAQWVNVSFNKVGENANYDALNFANANVGVVFEVNQNFSKVPSFSFNTFNGGKIWKLNPYNENGSIEGIFPLTSGNWIKAYQNIFLSTDSLKTWKKTFSLQFEVPKKMCVINRKNIFLLSMVFCKVIKSNDQGNTWSETSSLGFETSSYTLLDMSFPTAEVGYLVGKNSTITKTINGGSSWFNLTLPFGSYQLNGVDFVSETEGIIVAEAGKIFKTTDGGKTWKDYSLPNTTTLTAIDFIDANLAYACGYSGSIYKTTTGGKTWQQMESGTSNNLLAICFVDNTLGYCSGSGSTVLKLDNTPVPKITKIQANKTLYCEGDSATVSYEVNKRFDPSNFFVLQLSDGLGRFNQATELLRWNGDTSGKVKIKLPTGLLTDQNYRFRIYSTETELPSVANDSSIQINRATSASIALQVLPSTKLCEGETANLTAQAQNGGDKPIYKWFINSKSIVNTNATYSYKPKNLDQVTVEITSNSTCVSTATASGTSGIFAINPVPARPSITKDGIKLMSSASVGNQWFLNGSTMKDSTKQSISPIKQGKYSVRVSVNGCTSPMSALYDIIVANETAIEVITTLTLYPNPAQTIISIQSNAVIEKIIVYRSSGIKILESKATTELNVANLSQGLYLLEVWDSKGNRVVKKFEKR